MPDISGIPATRSVTFINQGATPDTYLGEGTLYADASGNLNYKGSNGTIINISTGGGTSSVPQPKFYFYPVAGSFTYIEITQYGTQATSGSVTVLSYNSGQSVTLNAATLGASTAVTGASFTANAQVFSNYFCTNWVQNAANSGIWVRGYGTLTGSTAIIMLAEWKVPSSVLIANTGTQSNLLGA